MTLDQIESLCVHPFQGAARSTRERLFYGLEELAQDLLRVGLRCKAFVDGSFLTEKPEPGDVDVLVSIDDDVMQNLTVEQRVLIDAINQLEYIKNIDSWAAASYPRGHQYFGTALDIGDAGDAYGLEHAKVWLKGIAVLRFGETDVGLRICR
jgi:hypothetical protein